jgi:hypothetical protein
MWERCLLGEIQPSRAGTHMLVEAAGALHAPKMDRALIEDELRCREEISR